MGSDKAAGTRDGMGKWAKWHLREERKRIDINTSGREDKKVGPTEAGNWNVQGNKDMDTRKGRSDKEI